MKLLLLSVNDNNKQGVQGLQTFAFCVLIVNDEHMRQT